MKVGEYLLKWTPLTAEERALCRSILLDVAYSPTGAIAPVSLELTPDESSYTIYLESLQKVDVVMKTRGPDGHGGLREGPESLLTFTAPDFDAGEPPPMPEILGLTLEFVRTVEH